MYPIVSYSTIYSSSLDDILLYDLHIYISLPVPNIILLTFLPVPDCILLYN